MSNSHQNPTQPHSSAASISTQTNVASAITTSQSSSAASSSTQNTAASAIVTSGDTKKDSKTLEQSKVSLTPNDINDLRTILLCKDTSNISVATLLKLVKGIYDSAAGVCEQSIQIQKEIQKINADRAESQRAKSELAQSKAKHKQIMTEVAVQAQAVRREVNKQDKQRLELQASQKKQDQDQTDTLHELKQTKEKIESLKGTFKSLQDCLTKKPAVTQSDNVETVANSNCFPVHALNGIAACLANSATLFSSNGNTITTDVKAAEANKQQHFSTSLFRVTSSPISSFSTTTAATQSSAATATAKKEI